MTDSQNISRSGGGSPLAMSNHKDVGRIYIGSAVLIMFAALIAGVAAAFESSDLGELQVFGNSDQFRQIWSAAREGLVLGSIFPAFVGLAIYLTPLQSGVSRLGFEKGVAASFWTWLLGLLLLVASYVMDGGPGGERGDFIVLWVLSLGMMSVALIWALSSVAATLISARAQGLTLARASISSWSFLVFSLAGSFVLAVFCAELVTVFIRVKYGEMDFGNSATLLATFGPFQRFPSAIVFLIPVLGIGADIVSVHTQRPIRDTRAAMVPIGLLGLISVIGGVSYFATVAQPELTEFSTAAVGVALACTVSILMYNSWKLLKGTKSFNPAMLAVIGSGKFAVGALVVAAVDLLADRFDEIGLDPLSLLTLDPDLASGETLTAEGLYAYSPIFSLVVGAAVLSIFAATYHWAVKIWGRHLNAGLAYLAIFSVSVGVILWTVGQIWASQVADQIEISVGSFDNSGEFFAIAPVIGLIGLAAGAVITIANIASLATVKVAGSATSKWEGLTLEWATTSPPLRENFTTSPNVSSAAPLEKEVFNEVEVKEIEGEIDSNRLLESGAKR